MQRNEQGRVKLTDMGLAKVIIGKTYTTLLGQFILAGTLHA